MPISKAEYVSSQWDTFSQNLASATQSLSGWIGGFFSQFFSHGTVGTTLLFLWTCDLFVGTALARRVRRDMANGTPLSPALLFEVERGKKKPFSWERFGMAIEKLAVWLVLALSCVFLREWIKHDNPIFFPVLSTGAGVVEFVLLLTEFQSVVHNAALYTDSEMLLGLSTKLSRAGDFALSKISLFNSSEPEPQPESQADETLSGAKSSERTPQ